VPLTLHSLLEDRPSIEQCLRDLGTTDPRDEKERIEAGKDSLLKECYAWILDDPNFRCWRDSGGSKLLWIKGDPGKGKTMMMIALAEELSLELNLAHVSTAVTAFINFKVRKLSLRKQYDTTLEEEVKKQGISSPNLGLSKFHFRLWN
jgi:hypothetical protein